MSDEKTPSTTAPEAASDAIQDLPQPPSEADSDIKGGLDITKTPSPGGPIPIPYPNLSKF